MDDLKASVEELLARQRREAEPPPE